MSLNRPLPQDPLPQDDAELRALGYYRAKQAHKERNDLKVAELYQQALAFISQIKNPKLEDIRFIIKICFDLGTVYFNLSNYQLSIQLYLKGIETLDKIQAKEDKDYRVYLNIFMNLSDAYSNLQDHEAKALGLEKDEAAEKSFSNAMLAYNQLHEKTVMEKIKIGENVDEKNRDKFRIHFETLLSRPIFFDADYVTNTKKIYQTQNTEQITKEMQSKLSIDLHPENLLWAMNTVSVNTQFSALPTPDTTMSDVTTMMDSIALDAHLNKKTETVFKNPHVMFPPQPNDADFRNRAKEKFNEAKNHSSQGSIFDTMSKYQAALQDYSQIKNKIDEDKQRIKIIEAELKIMNQKIVDAQNSLMMTRRFV